MIREILVKIFSEYPLARQEEFAGHPLAAYIRREVPIAFKSIFPDLSEMLFVASAGQGRWADAPWIAVFDPSVTETAQEGYYPVYLFNRTLSSVYLSLNQGMATLANELGQKQAKGILKTRAAIMQGRLGKYPATFSMEPINLEPEGSSDRLAMYEPGHTIGKVYQLKNLPSENDLIIDFMDMVGLYKQLAFAGGPDDIDAALQFSEEPGDYSTGLALEEKRRQILHRRIERNHRLAVLAKKVHGYTCQVCGFDFFEKYGELGREYIEAHHLVPLSELDNEKPAFLSPERDFAVVCANCHRMIHRPTAPKRWEDFLDLYRRQNPR